MIDPTKLSEWSALAAAATPGPMLAEVDMFSTEDGIVALVTQSDINVQCKDMLMMSIPTNIYPVPDEFDISRNIDPANDPPWTPELEAAKNQAWMLAKESQALKDACFCAAAREAVPTLIESYRQVFGYWESTKQHLAAEQRKVEILKAEVAHVRALNADWAQTAQEAIDAYDDLSLAQQSPRTVTQVIDESRAAAGMSALGGENEMLRSQLDACRAALADACEKVEDMHHVLTNGLCRRCEDSIRVCDLEEIDALRKQGGL